jgi:hypothetical protein
LHQMQATTIQMTEQIWRRTKGALQVRYSTKLNDRGT